MYFHKVYKKGGNKKNKYEQKCTGDSEVDQNYRI